MDRRMVGAALVLCVMTALALRVIPSYSAVFVPEGVNFQENDAWYHMRTVHNLLAHFPWRSGFDPYAIYPAGENIPTGPLFDYLLGGTAWMLGGGSPSEALADRVGAWIPALLGASFPLLVFWLGRRLFGDAAALFAAWWIALMPGSFLWLGHLGLADHHILESWLAFAALALVCAASESVSRTAWVYTIAAGFALGAYLDTRPAGIFIPAILIVATILYPDRRLARAGLGASAIAAAVFLPANGVIWSQYAFLSLAAGLATMVLVLIADGLWRRQEWPRGSITPGLIAAALPIAGIAFAVRPALFESLWFEIRRVGGIAGQNVFVLTVQEMRPLLRSTAGLSAWGTLFYQLGGAWIFSLPALIGVAYWAWRVRRPSATVFVVWSAVMTVAAFAQTRMLVYYGPIAALLAGAACARLVDWAKVRRSRLKGDGEPDPSARPLPLPFLTGAALVIMITATNLPQAVAQMERSLSPSPDWWQALTWMRAHTPEPMNDASAYRARYPAIARGGRFDYPASAYSVAVWWDFGYWVENIARRIPSSNGTQSGASVTARLLTDTSEDDARIAAHELGARFVVLDPTVALFNRAGESQFLNLLIWSKTQQPYVREFFSLENHRLKPEMFFLPDFYRSMAVRLYTFDGRSAEPHSVWVLSSEPYAVAGGSIDLVREAREFPNERAAREFITAHPEATMTLGGMDPTQTCVTLESLSSMREVFTSDPEPPGPGRPIHGVKVFEVAP